MKLKLWFRKLKNETPVVCYQPLLPSPIYCCPHNGSQRGRVVSHSSWDLGASTLCRGLPLLGKLTIPLLSSKAGSRDTYFSRVVWSLQNNVCAQFHSQLAKLQIHAILKMMDQLTTSDAEHTCFFVVLGFFFFDAGSHCVTLTSLEFTT